ncbi:MAG: SelB C-terminal domain-containing protein, partial [Gemmataceae bacterium]
LVQAVVDGLIRSKKILAEGRQLASATFKPKLSAGLRKIKDKVVATFLAAQYQPPEPGAFANLAGGNAQNLPDLFEVCVAEGHLVKVGDGLYLHAEVEKDMRQKLLERLSTGEGITVAVIRDLLGTTRKYAVPLCEYLDRIGLTRREGDLRYLGSRELAGAPSSSSLP